MKMAMAAASALMALSGAASAATVVHSYEFNGNAVTDSTGTLNGTMFGGATVAGGTLNLDGSNDYAQLSGKALDITQAYSVYVRFKTSGQNKGITEFVSQGSSGLPGFYLGTVGTSTRVTDYAAGGIGYDLPQDGAFHDILMTTGSGTTVYIDGNTVFTSATDFFGASNSGDDTKFGDQFYNYNEYFTGQIDRAKFFQGVATYAEATAAAVGGVPEPASWALMLGGFGMLGVASRRRRSIAVTA